LLLSNRTRQVFDTDALTAWKPSKRPRSGTLFFENLPDGLVGDLGMAMRLGVGDAFIEQPGIQFLQASASQARREEALAHQADLVLDLAFLPARAPIEQDFGCLKRFKRVALRCEKTTRNFVSIVGLAAALCLIKLVHAA
jgi:hypothetical protein